MAITYRISRSFQRSSDLISLPVDVSSGQALELEESIPIGNDQLVGPFALDVSQVKAIFMACDKQVTLETNSSSAAAATIVLKANSPLIWLASDGYHANPFGATDVTSLYVTNASGAAATLRIRILFDPTV
jgi:hypothetical protein